MTNNNNPKVTAFLEDLNLVDPEKRARLIKIRSLFLTASTELCEEIKYGGPCFNLNNELIGGIFLYKQHLSIEFSQGSSFDDPQNLLEGKGKHRRHLKIHQETDIENKKIKEFIAQAVK